MSIAKKTASTSVAIFLFVAGFLLGAGWNFGKPGAESPRDNGAMTGIEESARTPASMLIDTGEDLLGFLDIATTEGDTVFLLLEQASSEHKEVTVALQDYGDLGVLITSINGFENGTDDKYWQYWVNNQYANVAANLYQLKGGENIMWKFTKSKFKKY